MLSILEEELLLTYSRTKEHALFTSISAAISLVQSLNCLAKEAALANYSL